jgi:hypothetical protein
LLPTQKSYTLGAGNPRDSAMMATQQMNNKQTTLNSIGGKRLKTKGGANTNTSTNNAVPVPQFQMQYPPQGGTGTNPNDQIKTNSSTGMQSSAWAVNDNQATKMGGSKRKHKGGSSDTKWGCYSGGKKKRTQRKSRRNRRKSKRHHRN